MEFVPEDEEENEPEDESPDGESDGEDRGNEPPGEDPLRPEPSAPKPLKKKKQVKPHVVTKTRVKIDGRYITVVNRSIAEVPEGPTRLWDKEKRGELDPDQLQTFLKAATGYVLAKHSKLQVPNLKADADGTTTLAQLDKVASVRTQLEHLRLHCIAHDIMDVFIIVIPKLISKV